MVKPNFEPGDNIAIKVPSHQYDRTVLFYKDVLGLEIVSAGSQEPQERMAFKFGNQNLWINCAPETSQSELWLEVKTDNIEKAAEYFNHHQAVRYDDIEPLARELKGFWISSPANIFHLINE